MGSVRKWSQRSSAELAKLSGRELEGKGHWILYSNMASSAPEMKVRKVDWTPQREKRFKT